MYVKTWFPSTLIICCFLSSTAYPQSLLDRLEQKLKDAQPLPAQAQPAVQGRGTDKAPAPGYLGLTADDQQGVVEVLSVRAGGPADQAGIKPGDRLVSAGGVEVKSLDAMAAVVGKLPAGAKVEFVVSRDGKQQAINVTLVDRGGEPAEALPIPRNDLPPEEPLPGAEQIDIGPAQLGVRADPVTPDLQRRYGLTIRRGAVIQSIVSGSPADRYGLPLGGAIVAVDGARVDTPEDLAALIGSARPGDTVEISYYQREQAFRKKVRLVPVVNVAPGVAPAPGNDRPFLRKLERALDSAIAPERPLPANISDHVQALQAQVDQLQAHVDELERRLRAIEGPAKGATTPPPPTPMPPGPKLTEPKLKDPLEP